MESFGTVKPSGNSAHISISKQWLGKRVVVKEACSHCLGAGVCNCPTCAVESRLILIPRRVIVPVTCSKCKGMKYIKRGNIMRLEEKLRQMDNSLIAPLANMPAVKELRDAFYECVADLKNLKNEISDEKTFRNKLMEEVESKLSYIEEKINSLENKESKKLLIEELSERIEKIMGEDDFRVKIVLAKDFNEDHISGLIKFIKDLEGKKDEMNVSYIQQDERKVSANVSFIKEIDSYNKPKIIVGGYLG